MTTSQVLSLVWSFWEAHWPSVLIIITVVMIIAWFFWPDESTYHRLEREVGELRAYIGGTYTTFPDDNSYWGRALADELDSYRYPSEGGLENPIVHEESPSNPLPAIPEPRVDGQLIVNAPHRHGILSGGFDTARLKRAFETFERSVVSSFDGQRVQMGLSQIDDQPTIMTTDGRHPVKIAQVESSYFEDTHFENDITGSLGRK